MIRQCRFIARNKCTSVYEMSMVGEGTRGGGQQVYGNSVLSTQFFYEPKTALGNIVY